MREASNGKELIQDIKEKCQLNIRIISGEQEAYYLYSAVRHHSKNTYGAMALIDIGGGSTEISIAQDDKLIISKSFPIGTIRIMEASSQKALHQIIEQYQKGVEQLKVAAMPLLKSGKSLPMVGTGGNLRRFGKLRPHFFRSDETNSITLPELLFMQQELRKYTAKEIQKKYSLKRDRSQTIRPAMSLAISAMDMLGAKRLELPNFGLADGVILQMQST
jgi:exopolyphosphatase/guanosine-5'-triphosphate,3'-diphosphate pyrophosphatase